MMSAPTDAPASPQWSAPEMKQFIARLAPISREADPKKWDELVADLVGTAYRQPRAAAESADLWARRTLKKQIPDHPNVKAGLWPLAALRMFYDDASKRCDLLSRFERDRNERQYFDQYAKGMKEQAEALAKDVQTSIEGLEGYMAPLANVPACDEPEKYGVEATVRKGVVTIENIDRTKFVDDQPPAEAPRTARGALREVYSSFWNYNKSMSMLGMYNASSARNRGNVRLMVPGASPAIYINEIANGAIEGEMRLLRVMALKNGKDLCEVRVPLEAEKPKKKNKKAPETTPVKCKSDVTVERCLQHIVESKKSGPIIFVPQ
jgi:hypothetical protein